MLVHLSATNTPAVDKSIREEEEGKKGLQLVYFANKDAPNRIYFFFFSWPITVHNNGKQYQLISR